VDAAASDKASFAVGTGLASVLLVVAIWVVPVIPTNDGPQHVYAAHVSAHYDDPVEGYWKYYELAVPVTNTGFSATFSVLDGFLPWRHALRATLTVIVLTWSWGFMSLVLAIDRRRWALGLLGFATALNWSFYMGFWNFELAIGLGFATLALAIRGRALEVIDRFFVALLLLLGALSHIVAPIFTGAVIALVVLFRTPRERRVRELGLLVAMGAPMAAIAGLAARSSSTMGGPGPTPTEMLWVPFGERLAQFGACFEGGPAWRAWGVVAFAALGACDVAVRMRRREAASHEVALSVGAALMATAALATPFHLRAWQFFSPRFLPFAVLGVVPLFASKRRVPRVALHALAASYAGFSIAWSIHYHRALAAQTADALAGIDQPLRRVGPRLPIILDPLAGRAALRDGPFQYTEPLRSIGNLYATEQGGVVPYTFTGLREMHELMSRPGNMPPVPMRTFWGAFLPGSGASDKERSAMVVFLASAGAAFGDVIVIARPWVLDAFVAQGYETDWRQGGALIARFHGCPLELVVRGARPADPAIAVEYGWLPLLDVSWETSVPPSSSKQDVVVEVPHAPCGDVWVRVVQAQRLCQGADHEGRLVVRAAPGARRPVCTLVSPFD
jgi:hypothetical protein